MMRNLLIFSLLLLSIVGFFFIVNNSEKNSDIFLTSDDYEKSKVIDLHRRLQHSEKRVYSQNKEDGVIYELTQLLDLNYDKFFVEIGTQTGVECNSRFLRVKLGWKGLMLDGGTPNPKINLNQEIILHSNVVDIFRKYKVPKEFDFLSEDTDYADYWILESILTQYSPKVVLHEVNQQLPDKCVTVPKPSKLIFWDGSNFHGASVCAFHCQAKRFGYTMVYCEKAGVNCFWVRNDVLKERLKIDPKVAQHVLSPHYLFRQAKFVYRNTNNIWETIYC